MIALEPTREDVSRTIIQILRELCGPADLKGYEYTKDAVMAVYEDVDLIDSRTSFLYPQIAKLHDTKTANVERGIRYFIHRTWTIGSQETIEHLFKNGYRKDRMPTVGGFIARLVEEVRMRTA